MGATVAMGDELDRGARAGSAARCAPFDARPQPHSRRGDDRWRCAALFADGPCTLRNIAQLAREGDRPHRRDGHRAAQARRDGGGGRRLPRDHAARARSRPAPPSTPTTTTAWRCASRWPRWAACRCASTIRAASPRPSRSTSTVFARHRRMSALPPVIAIDGPSASGKGTVAAARSRERWASTTSTAARSTGWSRWRRMRAGRRRSRRRSRGQRGWRRGSTVSFDGGPRPARRRRRDRRDPHRGGRHAAPPRWPPSRPCARRCSSASARSASRPGWSPTAATWARWCFPTRRSRCS